MVITTHGFIVGEEDFFTHNMTLGTIVIIHGGIMDITPTDIMIFGDIMGDITEDITMATTPVTLAAITIMGQDMLQETTAEVT